MNGDVEVGGPLRDFRAGCEISRFGLGEDAADIREVLFRAAFGEVLELSENHVFRRSEGCGEAGFDFQAMSSGPGPGVEGVVGPKIDVGAEAGLVVDDVGVAAQSTGGLGLDDLGGRTVVAVFGERVFESRDRCGRESRGENLEVRIENFFRGGAHHRS